MCCMRFWWRDHWVIRVVLCFVFVLFVDFIIFWLGGLVVEIVIVIIMDELVSVV